MVQKLSSTLVKTVNLTPTVKGMEFKIDGSLDFKTGQWLMLHIPSAEGIVKRAMSIASPSVEKDKFHLCVKLVPEGKGSPLLHAMEVGEKMEVTGPFGHFTLRDPAEKDIVFIATGTGVAPFHAMLKELLEKKKVKNQVYLLFGNRTEDEIIYRKFFEDLAEDHENFHFLPTLSRPKSDWKGEIGYVQDLMRKYVDPVRDTEFYLCGLKEMVMKTLEYLENRKVPAERIHFERYS